MEVTDFGKSLQDRRIGLRLAPRSIAPRVLDALGSLGYSLEGDDLDGGTRFDDAGIWLVDAERLADLPETDAAANARLLVVGSLAREQEDDARIFAQTPRPGRLSRIYAMLQGAFEQTPRRTPRISTQLSARCIRSDRRSIGAVLSLSEGGCLLRTRESLRKGSRLDLQFALPDYGLISTRASCRYRRKGDAGLEFDEPASDVRYTIAHYVTLQLASLGSGCASNVAGSTQWA